MLRLTDCAPPERPFDVFSFATLLRKKALLAFALALAKAEQKQPERTSGTGTKFRTRRGCKGKGFRFAKVWVLSSRVLCTLETVHFSFARVRSSGCQALAFALQKHPERTSNFCFAEPLWGHFRSAKVAGTPFRQFC